MAIASNVSFANPKGSSPVLGLYSHVGTVKGGTLHFIAGQVSIDASGELVGKDDFDQQFARVFTALGGILHELGGDYSSIAKLTTYLVHSQDIAKFMKCRETLFPKIFPGGKYPPNTLLIIDRLVKEEFLIEVEAMAAI